MITSSKTTTTVAMVIDRPYFKVLSCKALSPKLLMLIRY